MIQHRLAIVVWLVLVLLAGRAVDGKAETLPRSADQAIDHTGDTRPYWTGRIEQDTTWRDTVYVGGDVTIAAAATLTLAPNTKVLFLPYRDDARGGLDTTRAELIVAGRLAAHAGGIVFGSADAGSLGADWYGLVIEGGGRADVSHAAIRDGLRCLYAQRGGFVRPDSIAFANCGNPTALADATGFSIRWRSTQPLLVPKAPPDTLSVGRERGMGSRIAFKLGVSAFVGTVAGVTLASLLVGDSSGPESDGIGEYAAASFGWVNGCTAGTIVSVTLIDPHDRFIMPLIGGLVGRWVGVKASNFSGGWSVIACPVVGATVASELWRDLPESSRFSLGLVPDLKGHLSAVATLRF